MSTNDSELYEKYFSHLRNVLPLFSKHTILPIPENYTVLYEYVSGENVQIANAFENLESHGKKLSNEFCEYVFNTFIKDRFEKSLTKLQAEISTITNEVSSIISKANQDTSEYSDLLSENERALDEKPSFESVMEMIGNLKQSTNIIHKKYQNMNQELDVQLGETDQLRTRIKEIKEEAGIDYLTQIANRKTLDMRLSELIKTNTPFCLAMVDIDFFKKFNDTYGHLVGDKVLKFVADVIKGQIKGMDLLARFGGEEFVVLLPETSLKGAEMAAENIRRTIEQTRFIDKKNNKTIAAVTVSIGVSEFNNKLSAEKLIEHADTALYGAKNDGRNQVRKYEVDA